jgi:hypothetical protein
MQVVRPACEPAKTMANSCRGQLAGEVTKEDMARILSEVQGFAVSADALLAAARAGQVSSRRAGGRRYFVPDAVLRNVAARDWTPHRSTRRADGSYSREWVTCGNPECTRGKEGQRWEGWLPRSRVALSQHAPTCSTECKNEVMRGRRRTHRSERRRCCCRLENGESCPRWIPVTKRQAQTDTGPRRCADCRTAGRPTAEAVQRWREAMKERWSDEEYRAEQRQRGHAIGSRNSRSPSQMKKMIEGSLTTQSDRQRRQVDLITAALVADAGASNLAIARDVGRSVGGRQCNPNRVAAVRRALEEAGDIEHRQWGVGVVAYHRSLCGSNTGGNCDCQPRWQAWVYDRTARRKICRSFATEAAATDWRSEQTAARPRSEPQSPFGSCECSSALEREIGGRALSRAQRGSERSQDTRRLEQRVREMWNTGATAEAIADQLNAEGWASVAARGGRVEARYVWKLRERLKLPRRKPGPRPKSS